VDDVTRRRQRVTPEVRHLGAGSAAFRVPFDTYWVSTVKTLVPGHFREWDPAAKLWIIDDPYIDPVMALTRRVFGYVDGAGNAHTSHHTPPSDPHVTLHLLPLAPPQLVDAAFRTLAKLAHPDAGGSHDAMLALSEAYDALRARVAS
jgi:hypothetical protein